MVYKTGAVKQHVETWFCVRQRRHCGGVGDIELHGLDPIAGDARDAGCFRQRIGVDVGRQYLRSLARKHQGAGAPDALAGSGKQNAFSL
jgi:hypothetical protein